MANEFLAPHEEMLDGTYPLGPLIRRSARGALYETEFSEGGDAIPAVIRIRETESAEAENLEQRLRNATQLAHPNLLKIYATGSSMLNGVPVFYVVMERAEESLEAVLAERALTIGETREMLAPALEALDFLHKKGYAHSRLRPSNVLAANDQLKLSADSVIRRTDDSAAEDLRALGVLILQALERKIPNPDGRREPQDFAGIPQPLAGIVQRCLDPDPARRGTAELIKASLNAPAIMAEKLPRPEEALDSGVPNAPVAKWIYAGLAALILAVMLAAVMRSRDSVPPAIPSMAAAQQDSPAMATNPTAAPTAETPQTAAPQAANPSGSKKTSGWSVIVGAYRSRELAEKRVREMTKKWPDFKIIVLESPREKSSYLVVLGRNLSEDQAQALRQRAVQSRLPGDTYIKRLM